MGDDAYSLTSLLILPRYISDNKIKIKTFETRAATLINKIFHPDPNGPNKAFRLAIKSTINENPIQLNSLTYSHFQFPNRLYFFAILPQTNKLIVLH